MFAFCLVLALATGAVLLALNARERVDGLVLVDRATGAVTFEGWAILLQHLAVAGILAAVVLLLALAIGLCASELHIRLALQRRRERLDRIHRDDQLRSLRSNCWRLEERLADAQRRLVAVKGQRADFRRSLRRATRERDRALKATAEAAAGRDPLGSAPSGGG